MPARPQYRRRQFLHFAGAAALSSPRLSIAEGPATRHVAATQTIHVANGRELALALARARPGTVILLAEGTYSHDEQFSTFSNGTADYPIVIASATLLQSVIRTNFACTHSYYLFYGLTFDSSALLFLPRADHCVVRRCSAINYDAYRGIWCLVRSSGIVFDRCALSLPRSRGISVDATHGGRDVLIERCHFYDWGEYASPHDQTFEPIQFGQSKHSTDISCNSTVRMCLFENINSNNRERETISVKSSNNTIDSCHFIDARYILVRHGNGNLVQDCYLEQHRGRHSAIGVFDRGNSVIRCTAPAIEVMAGDAPPALWPRRGSHPSAEETRLLACSAAVIVGKQETAEYTFPARHTTIERHDGPVRLAHEFDTHVELGDGKRADDIAVPDRRHVGPFS